MCYAGLINPQSHTIVLRYELILLSSSGEAVPEGRRQLAAIMFTDMVGYTALSQSNESQAMELLDRHNRLLRPFFPKYHGREVKAIGDSFLVEFESALDAIRCAVDIQSSLHDYNIASKESWKIKLRIGVHLGDVIRRDDDVFGDAVNIASRIEPISEPEGICVSQQVFDQVHNKFDLPLVSLGEKPLKNVSGLVEVYMVQMPWEQPPPSKATGTLSHDRIAVLPFANFSPDPNDEYFSDGITEEIISTVSGVSGLSVISRTSVMGYKGTTKKVREIGRELEVGSVLEGSFRKAGNRIRITTQLIDAASDKHLWAQSYERDLDDVFAVQSDIARQVANALRVRILPRDQTHIEKTPTRNPEAHALYLKGRYFWNQRSKESLLEAIKEYEAATRLDPDYALAYSGIADCYSVLGDHNYLPYAEAFSKCKEYALKAVERDDASAEAHTSLAIALTQDRASNAEAEAEFEKAIELNPSYATAHHWFAILMLFTARREAALQEALRAQKVDPLSPMIASFLGLVYDALGRYDEAERQHFRAIELQPEFLPAIGNLVGTYWRERKFADAEKQIEAYLKISKDQLIYKIASAANFALAGKEMEARRMMAEAEAIPDPTHLYDQLRIVYHLALGELDKAVGMIEDEYARGADWLGGITYNPLFAAVQNDPRVKSILRKVGAAL